MYVRLMVLHGAVYVPGEISPTGSKRPASGAGPSLVSDAMFQKMRAEASGGGSSSKVTPAVR